MQLWQKPFNSFHLFFPEQNPHFVQVVDSSRSQGSQPFPPHQLKKISHNWSKKDIKISFLLTCFAYNSVLKLSWIEGNFLRSFWKMFFIPDKKEKGAHEYLLSLWLQPLPSPFLLYSWRGDTQNYGIHSMALRRQAQGRTASLLRIPEQKK